MKIPGKRRTIVIGATSAIARATERLLAEAGDEMFLVARDREKLEAVSNDLAVRYGAKVHVGILDVRDFDQHEVIISEAFETLGWVDLVILAHGDLPDQRACQASPALTLDAFAVNALSVMSLLTYVSARLENQAWGIIAVVSSVAGERGRRSNYVYGSAKGAVSLFLQGLRSRLYPFGVRVLTVKPGLVDTPMTAGMRSGPLWATPGRIAAGLVRSIEGSKDVVYLPWYWRWIMLVVRILPEGVFKKLSF